MNKGNIYNISNSGAENKEVSDLLASGSALIERIVSKGQVTPENEWYDQDKDEWVLLLTGNATLLFQNSEQIVLNAGDYMLIRAHCKHRVIYTSKNPACIWLAIHANFS